MRHDVPCSDIALTESAIDRLLASNEFRDFRDYRPHFNILRELGVESRERSHSAALRFFLDPNEAHGWKDRFLVAFTETFEPSMAEEISNIPDDEITVRTEWKGIDVLVECGKCGPAFGIEVKLWAEEGDDQIKSYQQKLASHFGGRCPCIVFLTLDGRESESQAKNHRIHCARLSWRLVGSVLDDCIGCMPSKIGDVQSLTRNFRRNLTTMIEGDAEERLLVSALFRDPEIGRTVLRAARIRYTLFSAEVVRVLVARLSKRVLEDFELEVKHQSISNKSREVQLGSGHPRFRRLPLVFLFYDYPDDPDFGTGMHVLIGEDLAGFDADGYRKEFESGDSSNLQGLLEPLPGWGGNWKLALPSAEYPAGPGRGWRFSRESFDDDWLGEAEKYFDQALSLMPDGLKTDCGIHA